MSYSISTSNHNARWQAYQRRRVVSYSISTSNHNSANASTILGIVVSYSISTSNHNLDTYTQSVDLLCLILFLHQTTTLLVLSFLSMRCVLFYFYIKPQPLCEGDDQVYSCVLFYFYIKPQLGCCCGLKK